MCGETIPFAFSKHIACSEISYQDDSILNLLLHTGYLTAVFFDGRMVRAKIPNK